jgi:hypothetical protein
MYGTANMPRHGFWARRREDDRPNRMAAYPRDEDGEAYCANCGSTLTHGDLHGYDDGAVKDYCEHCADTLMATLYPDRYPQSMARADTPPTPWGDLLPVGVVSPLHSRRHAMRKQRPKQNVPERSQLTDLLSQTLGIGYDFDGTYTEILLLIAKGMFWSQELDTAARHLAQRAQSEMDPYASFPR